MGELKFFKEPVFWLVSLLALIWLAILQLPDQNLHLVFCDVGQGDATLISYRQTQILIDGGPGSRVLDCLESHLPFWDRKLEVVMLTHPEADHYTGLIEVFERYEVSLFVTTGLIAQTASFDHFRQLVIGSGARVLLSKTNEQLRLGPLSLRFLWPESPVGHLLAWQSMGESSVLGATTTGNVNETSLVAHLAFGQFDTLLTGDIGFETEEVIAWPKARIELLKVAHHGSKFSTGSDFLKTVKPKLAVVSVGKNSFGHPAKDLLDRLAEAGVKVLRNDWDGTVEVVSDGHSWWLAE